LIFENNQMKDKETLADFDSIAWSLLDSKADEVTIVDLNGIILFANLPSVHRSGRSVDEIIGNCVWDLYPAASKSHHKILFNQVAQTGQLIITRYKDKEQWNQILFYPIRGKENLIERIALCTWDITSRINAEERLKQVLMEFVTVQEDERNRISQDLHDDVGQKMTALLFELRALKEVIEKDQKVSLKEMNTIISNLELIIKHVRQIFYQLNPPSLDRIALSEVLAGFCSTFEETNHVHIDFSYQEGIPDLPKNYSKAIYRFVQEGLFNVAKHAKASAVWINLDFIDDNLNISLEDDGLGFDPKQVHDGIGLHGIRERFLMLSGNMEIESAPGKGTRLSGTIPFKANSA
jgi:PAS domain S-box-containing protein